LLLRVEVREPYRLGGVNLVLGEKAARQQFKDIQTTRDLGADDHAVVPVGGPRAGAYHPRRVNRTSIEERDLLRVLDVGPIEDGDSTLIKALHHDVSPGNRNKRAIRLSSIREHEIIEELSQHLDDRWRELVAGGASEDGATKLALDGFRDKDLLARRLAPLISGS
jgi:hypothetical protein